MEPLFVKVEFADGESRFYAILGRMTLVDFKHAVAQRRGFVAVNKVTFLSGDELPAIAEMLPLEAA